jgi:hypothetical protein
MKFVRKRLTYANVMSSIAVFLVVAGGSAFAANQLGKNTVGTKQLKNNTVTGAKIKNGAVTGAKLKLSSIGKVPSASTADSAGTANTAKTAETAKTADTAKTAGTANSANTANTANSANTAGTADLAKSLPALAWHTIPLQEGWIPYDVDLYGGAPTYTKDAEGFVHLEGAMDGFGATSIFAGVLPPGFRPLTGGVWVATASTNGASDPQTVHMEITSEGQMFVFNAPGAEDEFVGLTGIEFYVG